MKNETLKKLFEVMGEEAFFYYLLCVYVYNDGNEEVINRKLEKTEPVDLLAGSFQWASTEKKGDYWYDFMKLFY
jgi:hypothetical protein